MQIPAFFNLYIQLNMRKGSRNITILALVTPLQKFGIQFEDQEGYEEYNSRPREMSHALYSIGESKEDLRNKIATRFKGHIQLGRSTITRIEKM